MPFCSACGIEGEGDFCVSCGKPRSLPRGEANAGEQVIARMRAIDERLTRERHAFPALLSFFIPGLGQLVKGQILVSFIIFVAALFFGALCFVGVGFFMLPVLWLIQLYDAYVKPDAMLAGELREAERAYRQYVKD